jgi:hypothetical protein
MALNPNARQRHVDGHVMWEVLPAEALAEQKAQEAQEKAATGFVFAEQPEGPPKESRGAKFSLAVSHGCLLYARQPELLADVLRQAGDAAPLSSSADYQRVQQELSKLGADESSLRYFARFGKNRLAGMWMRSADDGWVLTGFIQRR